MSEEERRKEYEICKVRGHDAGGRVLMSYPPKNVCDHCGTCFWTEFVQHESNIPLLEDV